MEWELLGIILAGLASLTLYFFKIPVDFPSPSNLKDNREIRFDILRGFAMIGIVMIHIHSYFQFFHPKDHLVIHSALFLSNISRFSVPIFILTSAIFLKKKSGYWKSKLNHLVLPYFIFSIFGYLIKYQNYSFSEFTFFFLFGKVFTPFYFVPLLIQFYILFYVLNSVFIREKWSFWILLLSFVINLVSNLGYLDPILPNVYHSISIFNYLFFFVLGISIGQRKSSVQNSNQNTNFIFFVFFLVVVVLMILFSFLLEIDFKNHHLFYPIFMMMFVWIHLHDFRPKIAKILSYIGNHSLYIFLLHPFIIHFMHSFDPYIFGGPILGYIITLLLNVGLPVLISSIVQKGKILYQSHHFS